MRVFFLQEPLLVNFLNLLLVFASLLLFKQVFVVVVELFFYVSNQTLSMDEL